MRSAHVLCLLATLVFSGGVFAHEGQRPPGRAELQIGPGAEAPVAAVEEFSRALRDGDLARVESLLAPDALVLESGGAERSRQEYLREHAGEDAAFLKNARVRLQRRVAHAEGDFAWVASESEIDASTGDKPLVLLSTETMLLRRVSGAWLIVHIHWSSRTRPPAAP